VSENRQTSTPTLKLRVSDGKFIFVARTWSPVAAVDPFKSFCLFFPYRTIFGPKKFPPFDFSLSIYFFLQIECQAMGVFSFVLF